MTGRVAVKALFITWDGPQTRYLETLFLPIFRELAKFGLRFHVLQFCWGDEHAIADRRSLCAEAGIPYRRVSIMRAGAVGPLVTALLGARHIRRAIRDWSIDVLMPRSLMPALATLMLPRRERQSIKVVFDADGLAVDERVDFSSLSPHGLTYRLLRDVEAEMVRSADIVLARTSAAVDVLRARAGAGSAPQKFRIVNNGVDPHPFVRALPAVSARQAEPFTLCYVGSLGQQYRLPEMLEFAQVLRQRLPDLKFNIFTHATAEVRSTLARAGLDAASWISSQALDPTEIATALSRCDVGISLRRRSFSTQAVLPIKLGEYLLAGLPIIGTPGVGNTDVIDAAGLFHSGESEDHASAIEWVTSVVVPKRVALRQQCHELGLRHFSVEGAAQSYLAAMPWPHAAEFAPQPSL